MKREKALVENRRNQILEELRETGQLKIEQLAEKWQVSPLTIRRDLQALEEQKKIERFYGGATIVDDKKPQNESCYYSRMIAKFAAGLVEDGDSIFINTSMTALRMVEHFGDKRVTVITNNGKIMNMDVPPSVSILLTGGELRYPKYAMVGDFAIKNLESITAKKSFLGCSGLTAERGMTTKIMNEVQMNRLMFNQVSEEAYILADHTKIGTDSSFVSQEIQNIKNLITDEKASSKALEALWKKGVNITQVSAQGVLSKLGGTYETVHPGNL